jgi:uncharacterized protein YcfJ
MLPDFTTLTDLYTTTYNASLTAQGVVTTPTTAQAYIAHDAAAVAVLDRCDLLLTAGFLKAKFGAATDENPRQVIVNALASNYVGNRTTHTTAANNAFLTNAQTRCKNIAYLVATSPQALILK